ncbi:PQQ-binding-like beta-propeller repeat protein [Streptomyces sp. BPTC-684]|uniref:protein kinase domain-containing protein n=1 Tax=Streptomyces sp. BPTC-684 TaxID=3043734 RepID=UPI0024B15565|nr:PQQ-binding-like beta-propeller repeat protein [Streptomyces sp. BPTC-684]WHM39314.1 PQQ-binding-like beta-propeller repeat protein [Streptomyces sp. BPTC-684]
MREIGGYRLVALLGDGGMGQVHLARAASGRLVALKTVHPHLAADPRFRERFRREVAAARAVDGPYTAGVLAADPDAEPPWLATAYAAGPALSEAVSALGPLGPRQLAALGALLAEALAAVHAAHLVHRDLKPANVIVTRDGPKVIDFGIAKGTTEEEEGEALTRSSETLGSPGFIAPEQLARQGEPGPPADVFALGGLLALCATGRNPFGAGSAPQVLYRTLHEEPDLDGVPGDDWREFLGRCLAREPADRPAVAEVLAWCAGRSAPEPWWEQEPVTGLIRQHEEATAELIEAAPAVADVEPPARASRRRFLLWSASGAVAAAGISTAVALGKDESGSAERPAPTPYPRGRALWTRDLGPTQYGGALIRHGDALYVHDNASLTRLDPATGAVRWQRDAKGVSQVVPHGKDVVHVVRTELAGAPTLAALDAATGDTRWETRDPRLEGLRPRTSLLPDDVELEGSRGMFALGDAVACFVTYESYDTEWSRRAGRKRPWRAYGYDPATGEGLWYHEGTAAGVTAVRYAGGRFAVAASVHARSDEPEQLKVLAREPLHVLRASDGRPETTITGGALRPDAHPGATGTGYFALGEAVSAVDLAARTTLWSRGVTGSVSVTPTATGGLVHAASHSEVSALDATTGRTRWLRTDVRRLTDAPHASPPPLLSEGRLYVTGPEPGSDQLALGGPKWGLHALDPATGKLVWAVPFEGRDDLLGCAGGGLVHVCVGSVLTTFRGPDGAA